MAAQVGLRTTMTEQQEHLAAKRATRQLSKAACSSSFRLVSVSSLFRICREWQNKKQANNEPTEQGGSSKHSMHEKCHLQLTCNIEAFSTVLHASRNERQTPFAGFASRAFCEQHAQHAC
eukprot:364281-Amphidinium_carterae.1